MNLIPTLAVEADSKNTLHSLRRAGDGEAVAASCQAGYPSQIMTAGS